MNDFAAALLAGGRSRRMGTDKAFLNWQGCPLWKHQLEKLRSLEPAQLLLSCRAEQSAVFHGKGTALTCSGAASTSETGHRPAVAAPPLQIVPDSVDNCGPLTGIVACLRECTVPRLVALAVDLPQLPAEFLRSLLNGSSAQCGAVVRLAGYYEPLAAVYPRAILPLAEKHLASRRLALQDLIAAAVHDSLIRCVAIPAPAEWFVNWNSPEDLETETHHPAPTVSGLPASPAGRTEIQP